MDPAATSCEPPAASAAAVAAVRGSRAQGAAVGEERRGGDARDTRAQNAANGEEQRGGVRPVATIDITSLLNGSNLAGARRVTFTVSPAAPGATAIDAAASAQLEDPAFERLKGLPDVLLNSNLLGLQHVVAHSTRQRILAINLALALATPDLVDVSGRNSFFMRASGQSSLRIEAVPVKLVLRTYEAQIALDDDMKECETRMGSCAVAAWLQATAVPPLIDPVIAIDFHHSEQGVTFGLYRESRLLHLAELARVDYRQLLAQGHTREHINKKICTGALAAFVSQNLKALIAPPHDDHSRAEGSQTGELGGAAPAPKIFRRQDPPASSEPPGPPTTPQSP